MREGDYLPLQCRRMVLRKLVLSNLSHRRVRTALTVAAIALAVSLVVSVTSGYASAEAAVYKYLSQYMGSVDVEIFRSQDPATSTSEEIVALLRADPDVEKVDARYESNAVLTDLEGESGPRVAVIGVRRPDDRRSDYLTLHEGQWFDVADGEVAVIDQAVAASLAGEDSEPLKVGDQFILPGIDKELKLTVVGIVHKPEMLASFMQTIYVPLETIQRFADKPDTVSRIMVDLKLGADDLAFERRWAPRLKELDPTLRIRLARETRREMEKNLQGIHVLSYMGGAVSMLAATFIVFSALSMGVTERQRTLAMLRAVGAQKSQVARLVIGEGLLLGIAGAALGVPLGWMWIQILALWYAEIFTAGVVPGWGGIIFGSLGSIAAALAASVLPAVAATRVSPLEAMSPLADPPAAGVPWIAALLGILLISIDPFLFFGPVDRIVAAFGADDPRETGRAIKFWAHFALGLPGIMVGFFLLAPFFVWLLERIAGPLVAAMFGLRYALLRQQLGTGIWRVAGTCAALMVGLSVLVVLQTNGNTMLKGWVLPTKFPDIFIMTSALSGLQQDQVRELEDLPGIRPGEVMPIGIASPELGASFFNVARAVALLPDATMFIAVDPSKAFDMMQLEFREGNAKDASRLLAQGDHLVITEEFRQLKGLGVGDKFPLKTKAGKKKDFTIAAVVWSPGIDVMVAMFDMNRQFDQRTAASVFGSMEDGRKYFGIEQVYLFAANLEYHVEREQILKNIQERLGRSGMAAGDVRQIKHEIETGLRKILLLVSTVAFAAMAVSSLGVTNTVMASIRTRRWQFGILRSIGVTRGQLLRLVLAEAFLIGLVGCALGLGAGFVMSLDANALSATVMGYAPPIDVPWGVVWLGTALVMFIAIAASIWPALSVARAEPLSLLQAGRASD